nr:ATP-binding sensor histidine kinase [Lusitaniella coriacea]
MMTNTLITLPGYQLAEQIYNGSSTLVHRGTRNTDEKPVIIKFLRSEYPTFSELVQFRNQYTIAKNLNLLGIVKPLALETYRNGYALVMPDEGYVSLQDWHWETDTETRGGGDAEREFQSTLNTQQLSVSNFLSIGIQLADILHGLYQNRVIHKDIKPANILIHPQTKQVKLIDFSISSLLPKETQEIQNPNVLEGTLAYISPEQTGRMNRGIDYRSDFYSLGVTFYELLKGKLPFKSDDPMELMHCHIAKSPISITNKNIPQTLSDIVMKLMAKNVEDRYQNALGLKYDLEQCLKQWTQTRTIEEFELGQRDVRDRFIIPDKLYGREAEVAQLLAAFERVANGNSEMMLVAGYSGIGKTAVINEVHKPIVRQRGYFIKGKFDQFNRNIPFSAFVQAFRDLMGQLLSESDAQLEQWRDKILSALGENGQVIIDVIPELKNIIGQQPAVPELSGSAAQNRFNLLFGKFIKVFTTKDHPLVLFLDDLQWADSASLNLLKLLMGESETGYFLVLGAYRDNEVYPAHPLMLTLDEIKKNETTINTIILVPLTKSGLNYLISDTLSCSLELAIPLTKLVYQKTKGNPFFATQFLKGLYEDGEITFNLNSGYWQCNMARVRQLSLTDDVVEFMASRLHRLPVETQEVMKLAACIGNTFDLSTLAIVSESSQEKIATALWKALQEGLVLPANETYKFFQGSEKSRLAVSDTVLVGYEFLHDRVQQAAYSLIPQTQKSLTHYRIGKLLFQKIGKEERNDRIFEIVNNLNYGIDLIDEQCERIKIANLNLKAARKAKKSVAYSAASEYINSGIELVGMKGWDNEYQLIFDLHKEGSEAEYLNGNMERSESLAFHTLENARSATDKAEIYNILIIQHTLTSKFQDAVNEGKIALELLGIEWDENNLDRELDEELNAAKNQLGDRKISSLIDLPEMEIPEKRSAIKVLHTLLPLTYSFNQPLWRVLIVKIVNLSLQYGHIPECCFGYSFYGVLMGYIFGDYESGYEFGILSLNLSQKFKDLAQESKACNILAAFLLQWRKHISHCEKINNQGYSAGLESGQLQFIGYIAYNRILSLFHSGKNLNELLKEFPVYLPVLEEIKHYYAYDITVGCQLAVQTLTSSISKGFEAQQQEIEDAQHLEVCRSRDSFPGTCAYQIFKAQISYLFDRPEEAHEYLCSAQEILGFLAGHFTFAEYFYYRALTFLKLYPNASIQEKPEILEQFGKNREQLQVWADNCPENFQHKLYLVEAEQYRVFGEKLEAIESYDLAISGAEENHFIQEEALANELAAKFYLDWGKEKIAQTYMVEAYYCYARWGAKAKTDYLEQTYPQLLAPILQQSPTPPTTSTVTHTLTTSTASSSALDFTSAIKASQALSGEIELNALLSELMGIVLENAGADTGALILNHSGNWVLAAQCTDGNTQSSNTPLDETNALPLSIINTVKRTQNTLLINQLAKNTTFARDPYLAQKQPQSLFCTPILNQGKLIGILYLENNLSVEAFTPNRIEILNLLTSQAAISIENAHLYNTLEQKVQQRTAQLSKALEDLKATQTQLVESEKMAALGGLVAGVAHEINTPIGTSITVASTLADETQTFIGAVAGGQLKRSVLNNYLDLAGESTQLMLSNLHRAGELIQSFKQIATDQNYLERRCFNLKQYLEEIALSLAPKLKQTPHILIVEGDETLKIESYPGALAQIVTNLATNSLTHAYPSGEAGKLRFHISKEGDKVRLEYGDDGCGIEEENLDKIFEPFFTTARNKGGTGLGLHIVYNLVTQKLRGTMDVRSEVNMGTIFVMTFPPSFDC